MVATTLSSDARTIMNPYAPFLTPGPLGSDMAVQLSTGLYTGIPVVDQHRHVLGIVTQDNLNWVRKRGEDLSSVLAEQIMTVLPAYLHEDMTIEEVGEHLLHAHVMQLPVVRDETLIGVITRSMVFGQTSMVQDRPNHHFLRDPESELHAVLPGRSFSASCTLDTSHTILVVDDNSAISRLLSETLESFGYGVQIAENGKKALQMIHDESFIGILLDLEMPVMDGATVLDELRWQNIEVPVVVMSGTMDPFRFQNMLQEGAQGCLGKPFTLEALHAQCERCFGPPVDFARTKRDTVNRNLSPRFPAHPTPVGV